MESQNKYEGDCQTVIKDERNVQSAQSPCCQIQRVPKIKPLKSYTVKLKRLGACVSPGRESAVGIHASCTGFLAGPSDIHAGWGLRSMIDSKLRSGHLQMGEHSLTSKELYLELPV